jgi:hypothetical protein
MEFPQMKVTLLTPSSSTIIALANLNMKYFSGIAAAASGKFIPTLAHRETPI